MCFPLPLPCNAHAGATVVEISACSAKQSAAIRSHKHVWARSQPGGGEHPDLLWGFSTPRTVVAPAGTALCLLGVGRASSIYLGLKVMLWSMGSPQQASQCACRRLEAPRTRDGGCPCPSSQTYAHPLAIAIYYGKKNVRRAPGCRNPLLAPHQGRGSPGQRRGQAVSRGWAPLTPPSGSRGLSPPCAAGSAGQSAHSAPP